MQYRKATGEPPASNRHRAPAGSPTPRWELDAALAVLARTHDEWAALAHTDADSQLRCEVARRLESAQQLVTRIHDTLEAAHGVAPS